MGHVPSYITKPANSSANHYIALFTMALIFSLFLGYPILICLVIWYNVWIHTLLVFVFLTLYPFSVWVAFTESRVLESWRQYFNFCVYKSYVLDKQQRHLFVCVPHGLFPFALTCASGVVREILPELEHFPPTAIASNLFVIPLLSTILRWFGCIHADSDSIKAALCEKGACFIVPDGIAGIYHSCSENEMVYLNKRSGYIRAAMDLNAKLVPVYCFGHTQVFDVYPKHSSWISRASRWIRFSIVWFWPIIPRRKQITAAFGTPVETSGTVDEVRDRFIKAVHDTFDRYKHDIDGWSHKELIIC